MRAKQLSNPFSSGSGGSIFESRVQAAFVALMLAKGVCPCLPPWPIYKVKVQAKHLGYATDDVVVSVRNPDSNLEAKLIAQIKHAPSITPSDTQFAEVIQATWQDFRNPELFDSKYDALALITGPLSATDTYDVREMLELARMAQDGRHFFENIKLGNFSSAEKERKLEVFCHHLTNANDGQRPDDENIWKFLKSFHLLGYDLNIRSGVSLSLLQSVIGLASDEDVETVWLKILNEVQSRNPRAGTLTLDNIPQTLLDCFQVRRPPKAPAVLVQFGSEAVIAALIGEWDENDADDRTVVEELTGQPFDNWQGKIREIHLASPGIFEQRNGLWNIIDRLSFWETQGPRVSDDLLQKFKQISVGVLREKDPSVVITTPEDGSGALDSSILRRRYSARLRKGVAETLALLSTHKNSLSTCTFGKAKEVAVLSVLEILSADDWELWASLDDVLPILAEASPTGFLDAVHAALETQESPFLKLFNKETTGFFHKTYSYGLLRGLEVLAWSDKYIIRVCLALAGLAAIDPNTTWSNRPVNSLIAILLPWYPQTYAGDTKRRGAVNCVVKEFPVVGWRLLLSLLPKFGSHASSHSNKPVWRSFISATWTDTVSGIQYWGDVEVYAQVALSLAGTDAGRIVQLVERYFRMLPTTRLLIRERLCSDGCINLPEEDRLILWRCISEVTAEQREFAGGDRGSELEQELEQIDEIGDRLKPMSPEVRHKRLFGDPTFHLLDCEGTDEEQHERLRERRKKAVSEILQAGGLPLLLKFAEEVKGAWLVGRFYGFLPEQADDQKQLPVLFGRELEQHHQFASGYVASCYESKGWEWVDSLDTRGWPNLVQARYFGSLPFCRETWSRMKKTMGDNEGEYWKHVFVPFSLRVSENMLALDKLIEFGRPDVVIHLLYLLPHKNESVPSRVAISALKALQRRDQINRHNIGELIAHLQSDPTIDKKILREVEWKFLPLLSQFDRAQPRGLFWWMAEDPKFFCEAIRMAYRASNETQELTLTNEEKDQAINAYRLLRDWCIPPGTQRNNAFDLGTFDAWLAEVKTSCIASGHWGVAAKQIGKVLFYSPKRPSGLWIEGVCSILNIKEHENMRAGLSSEIFDSRGVVSFSRGQEELEISAKWGRLASSAEDEGYSRLGAILRKVAEAYRYDAEMESRESLS